MCDYKISCVLGYNSPTKHIITCWSFFRSDVLQTSELLNSIHGSSRVWFWFTIFNIWLGKNCKTSWCSISVQVLFISIHTAYMSVHVLQFVIVCHSQIKGTPYCKKVTPKGVHNARDGVVEPYSAIITPTTYMVTLWYISTT